jgi:outer membrane protein
MIRNRRVFIVVIVLVFMIAGQGQAQDLNFSEILSQALVHSYDLKMGRIEKEIREERCIEARALYFPSISLRYNNEYVSDLGRDAGDTVSVGGTIIPGNESAYQHSMDVSAQFLLYDFGVRRLKYQSAKRDITLAEHTAAQRLIDLKIEVLSLFGTGLQTQKKIETWDAMLNLRKEMYGFTQRLVAAGSKDKPEQGMAAIAVAEALQNYETLRLDMAGVIEKLGFYTGKSLPMAEVRFMDFPDQAGAAAVTDVSKLPGIRAYDVAIEQKTAEVDIARRHWLPTLSLYSSYRLYGNDRTDFINSFENLREKSAAFGLMANTNLFNGFSDVAKVRRLKKELEKLQIEKEKKLAEEEQKVRTLAQKNRLSEQGLQDAGAYRAVLSDQGAMGERLSLQQVIDRISFLQQKEDQMEKQLTLELAAVERCVNALQLQMLAQGTKE